MAECRSEPAAQRELVRALCAQLGAQLIETHISFVLLAGAQAYKIKKAVNLGFVDFRTLASRRFYCDEELRLNRRTAPQLYQRVLPIGGSSAKPVLGGEGAAIEWALQMRAFDQEGLWDRMAARGALQACHVDALVEALLELHRQAAVAPGDSPYGRPEQLRAPMTDNLRELGRMCHGDEEQAALAALRDWEARCFVALQSVFAERRADGHVREVHGDLHLGNVTQHEGRTLLFDGLEFDAALRWTDVVSDVAFLAMDLQAHHLAPLAHRFVNACIERSGDLQGLQVLRYYQVHRALVRAKVAGLRAGQLDTGSAAAAAKSECSRYLRLALRSSLPGKPALMLTHGFSGSGKTALTQSLLEAVGAIRFRADVERKRLFGLDPLARSDAAGQARLYSPQAGELTQARLREHAALALQAGYSVILDATFLHRAQRDAARDLAARMGVRFVIIDFQAPLDTLRRRLAERARQGDDASDADQAVLESQRTHAQALGDDERRAVFAFDAGQPIDAAAMPARWAPLLSMLGADAGGVAAKLG